MINGTWEHQSTWWWSNTGLLKSPVSPGVVYSLLSLPFKNIWSSLRITRKKVPGGQRGDWTPPQMVRHQHTWDTLRKCVCFEIHLLGLTRGHHCSPWTERITPPPPPALKKPPVLPFSGTAATPAVRCFPAKGSYRCRWSHSSASAPLRHLFPRSSAHTLIFEIIYF